MTPSLPRQQRTIDVTMKLKSLHEMEKMVDEESVISNTVKNKPEMTSKLIHKGVRGWGLNNEISFPEGHSYAVC